MEATSLQLCSQGSQFFPHETLPTCPVLLAPSTLRLSSSMALPCALVCVLLTSLHNPEPRRIPVTLFKLPTACNMAPTSHQVNTNSREASEAVRPRGKASEPALSTFQTPRAGREETHQCHSVLVYLPKL